VRLNENGFYFGNDYWENKRQMNKSKRKLISSFMKKITILSSSAIACAVITSLASSGPGATYPNAENAPDSSLMLTGDWFDHPHRIDVSKLPQVPREHIVVNDVTARNGVNQHNYLIYHDGLFWAMWSDGPAIEDRVGQVVKYSTSVDGKDWSDAKYITGYPPDSEPGSEFYNTRSPNGFRYIARGFWNREDELLALVSLDEAAGFFGPSLKLLAYRWDPEADAWNEDGVVYDNAINNFSPKRLPTGEWMMSRRPYNYSREGVDFLIGGVKGLDQWEAFPVPQGPLTAEEPYWWELPDGNLMALFRDNRGSGYVFRSFSTDNGISWSQPVRTDFPDARSKFHGVRMSDGRYVLVSNSHPNHRQYLTLAVSDDGMVFDRLYHLVTGDRNGVDYPMVMEHEGYLYIAHSGGYGGRKQSVEIQRVRISDLDDLEMVDARIPPPYEPGSGDIVLDHSDEARVMVRGAWGSSARSADRFGDSYLFLPPREAGLVQFSADLPAPGKYGVYVMWNSLGTRDSSVPYTITHARGSETVIQDQRDQSGEWVKLGVFHFEKEGGSVEIRIEEARNYVIADAVLFSPEF
jgi:hypothetical protein